MRTFEMYFRIAVCVAVIGSGCEAFALPGISSSTCRMNPAHLQIGITAFRGDVATEDLVRETKEAGFDFVASYENVGGRAPLDMLQRHGLGCVLGGAVPRWWGGSGRNGKMAETYPLELFERAGEAFSDHPAIWGIAIGDEPSALDFPHFGNVARTVARVFPAQFPFLCIYPIYALPGGDGKREAAKSLLGVPTYRQYVQEYCQNMPLDYIQTDVYPWGWSVRRSQFVENLRLIAEAALGSGRSWGMVLQQNRCVDGPYTNRVMTANTMRFQAFTAMAYGAERIMWACWTTSWWRDNFIEDGRVNPASFERLRTVNGEIHAFGPQYMRFRRVMTDLVGFDAERFDPRGDIGQPFLARSNGSAFSDVRSADGSALVVGHFVARDGSGARAMFVAAADDPEGETTRDHVLLFKTPREPSLVLGCLGPLTPVGEPDGSWLVPLRSNQALLMVEE